MNNGQRLWRSNEHRMIAGVCGGIAEWLGWTPLSVRLIYVLASVCSAAFPGIIVYLILWLAMPRQLPLPQSQPAGGVRGDPAT